MLDKKEDPGGAIGVSGGGMNTPPCGEGGNSIVRRLHDAWFIDIE